MEKLYIVGHPVAHSKSPAMYHALYARLGLDWQYDFCDLDSDASAETFFQERNFLSCNITTPYKQIAFASATIPAATAKLAGGANVLVNMRAASSLVAYNVDGKGCIGYLELQGVSFHDANVVVCGTGPTSLAIVHAAAEAGVKRVTLLSRSKGHAEKRLQNYLQEYRELLSTAIPMPAATENHLSFEDAYYHADYAFTDYASAQEVIQSADVIVDATPLGMQAGDVPAFNTAWLHAGQVVMDVVYGHGETALISEAKQAGANTYNGSGMLVCQAIDTAEILFDIFHVANPLSRCEMYELMRTAAGFDKTS